MRRVCVLLGIGLLALGARPSEVEACTPCVPTELVLGGDELQPGNSGLWAWNVDPETILAFVDEQPAAIEIVDGFDHTGFGSSLLVRPLEPAPPGALVRFEAPLAQVCFGQRPGIATADFIAIETDLEPPEPAVEPLWDLHVYRLPPSELGCFESLLGTIYVHMELLEEPEPAAPRLVEIEIAAANATIATHRSKIAAVRAARRHPCRQRGVGC